MVRCDGLGEYYIGVNESRDRDTYAPSLDEIRKRGRVFGVQLRPQVVRDDVEADGVLVHSLIRLQHFLLRYGSD